MFHYLLSYHYYAKTDLDKLAEASGTPDLTFLADSGAFSAFHAGAQVTVEDYVAWIKRWDHRLHAVAALDVLGDHKASIRNTQKMRDLGVDPLPVFHLGEPITVLEQYLAETEYMAIGGMVKASVTMRDRRLWKYLATIHQLAGEAGVKLHGFGLSSWPVIRRFPWYSVDSSSAGSGYRYGRCTAYDPFADKWAAWALRDAKAWHRHGWLVREYGLRPQDFKGSNTAIRGNLIALAARSWARAAQVLADDHATRSYVTDGAFASNEPTAGGSRIKAYEDGNRWTTKVYVADGATSTDKNGGAGAQLLADYEDGKRWATKVYVTDPHPSANKNCERIATWEDGNQWASTTTT